jgi:dTDP-4-amino-4,6-dideoxygalactose transaminase
MRTDKRESTKGEEEQVVPILDLGAQYRELQEEIDRAVADVLGSGWYILGNYVRKLEEEMRSFLSLEAAFGCANGTDALITSLMALGLEEGDEVLLPAFSFVAPLEAVVLCGATPRFVDVDYETYNIDPEDLKWKISSRTRAIIVVHLFGQCCDMDPILEAASPGNIMIIEDAAQVFGASYRGKRAGSIGDICCFSFYPTKNLGCAGDGGLIGTTDPAVVNKLRYLRIHGEEKKYRHTMVGMNSRLDEIQAAILLAKLPSLKKWNMRRAEIAAMYDDAFRGLDVKVPVVIEGNNHIYHQYTLRVPRREEFISHLSGQNVATAIHYPLPLNLQPAYAEYDSGKGSLPVAERLTGEVISLPIFPQMTDSMIDQVIEGVRSFFRSSR